ncbi:MAG: site-2 protease family protein [Fimbriimonadaceae bacterium]|nr:site-2 protease family protein [Fimbriimonadaceae bacterium]
MGDVSMLFIVCVIPVILISVALHEFAHAKMADLAGDPTPRFYRRVTLNPLAHLDPLGTVMIVITVLSGFGIGWGKPVPVNPSRMKNPRWDHFASVAAGPLSNVLQATVYAVIARLMMATGVLAPQQLFDLSNPLSIILVMGVMINIGLALFNMIPLGPLDGHWIVGAFLPERQRIQWYAWNRNYGGFLFLSLIILGQIFPNFDVIGMVFTPLYPRIFQFFFGF